MAAGSSRPAARAEIDTAATARPSALGRPVTVETVAGGAVERLAARPGRVTVATYLLAEGRFLDALRDIDPERIRVSDPIGAHPAIPALGVAALRPGCGPEPIRAIMRTVSREGSMRSAATAGRRGRIVGMAVGLALGAAMALSACSGSSGSSAPHSTAAAAADIVQITATNNHLLAHGHPLYTFTGDTTSSSQCTGACAQEWIPLLGSPVVGPPLIQSDFAGMTRSDGRHQVTFDGQPVYEFSRDTSATPTGDGVSDNGGTWHLATVSSALQASTAGSGGSGY